MLTVAPIDRAEQPAQRMNRAPWTHTGETTDKNADVPDKNADVPAMAPRTRTGLPQLGTLDASTMHTPRANTWAAPLVMKFAVWSTETVPKVRSVRVPPATTQPHSIAPSTPQPRSPRTLPGS
jgi:hypothetical protein